MLGTLTVDPKYLSFADGFFVFPTQTLIHATPDTSGQGQTTAFEPGQNLDAYTSFVDTSVMTPAVKRALTITDGIGNDKASNNDPKAVIYMFDDNTFPNIPLIQPRLNSVEEWLITNFNNDAHPMHIHVNDFQVMAIDDPNRGKTGVQPWGLDNVNVPAPIFDENARREHPRVADAASGVPRVRGHLCDPLPPPQPRGQRADGAHQRHPRGVDVRGGDTGIQRQARIGAGPGCQRRQGACRPSSRSRTSRAPRRWRWPT